MKNNIEIIVRAVILHRNKILLCKEKKGSHYFLPGGHIEFGEPLKKALLREIKEELSAVVKKADFLGIVENFFRRARNKIHEINFVYFVSLRKLKDKTTENHIDFHWIDTKSVSKEKLLPVKLKKRLISWIKTGKF